MSKPPSFMVMLMKNYASLFPRIQIFLAEIGEKVQGIYWNLERLIHDLVQAGRSW